MAADETSPQPARDLDPELVSLRSRLPIGPILAASVLGFALLMMWRLRADFAFSRQSETPVDLGRLRDAKGPLPDNGFVSVQAEVDAFAPGRLRGMQDTGRRLAPALGTAGRIWIHEPGEAIDVTPTYDGRFVGRLRPLDDLPFSDELRGYAQLSRPRFVFPEALEADRLPATDVHGEPVVTTPDTPVAVEERVADAAVVTQVQTPTITEEIAAHKALEAAGLKLTLLDQSDVNWTYEVPEGIDAARAKLREARLFGASVEPKIVAHNGKMSELAIAADTVTLAGKSIPRTAVDHIEISVTQQIPEDAWVLLTGDTPRRLWYMPLLYGGLSVIALLMVWALAVTARHVRKQRAHPPV